MWPTFDASLAMEMMAFASPEAREGYEALRDGRRPAYGPASEI
jgi:hypothetical protein